MALCYSSISRMDDIMIIDDTPAEVAVNDENMIIDLDSFEEEPKDSSDEDADPLIQHLGSMGTARVKLPFKSVDKINSFINEKLEALDLDDMIKDFLGPDTTEKLRSQESM